MYIKTVLSLMIIFFTFQVYPQKSVDKLRLKYEEDLVSSNQLGVKVSEDGKRGVFYFDDGVIKILDFQNGQIVKKIVNVSSGIFDLLLSPDNDELILFYPNSFEVFNLKTDQKKVTRLNAIITLVSSAPSKNLFAIGFDNATTAIYSSENYGEIKTFSNSKGKYVSGLDFNTNGNYLAIGVFNGPTQIFNTSNWELHLETKSKNQSASYSFVNNKIYMTQLKSSVLKEYMTYGLAQRNAILSMLDLNTKKVIKMDNVFKASDLLGFYNLSTKSYDVDLHYSNDKLLSVTNNDEFLVRDLNTNQIIFTTKNDKYSLRLKKSDFGIGAKQIHPLYDGHSYLISFEDNNVSYIYDLKDNMIKAYIFMESNGRKFVSVTREGKLDGDIESISKLYWTFRFSSKKTTLDATFEKYYTPRLLPTILSGESVQNNKLRGDLASDLSNIPVISIGIGESSSSYVKKEEDLQTYNSNIKNIFVSVSIDSLVSEAKKIRLYHNGKLIVEEATEGKDKLDFEINLNKGFGDANYLYAVVFNKFGIQSEKAKLTINYTSYEKEQPKLISLVIGINNYKNPKYALNYALSDAKGIAEQLEKTNSDLFASVKTFTLFDEEVTKENILKIFKKISNEINEQDLFIFYYAGHGTMSESNGKREFFLVPYQITQLYGNDAVLNEKGITSEELKNLSKTLNSQKQVYIIDACHSAAALESIAMRGAAEEQAIAKLARSTGTFWLTAAGSDQFATEFESLGHGVFTYAILNALRGGDKEISGDKVRTSHS